LQTFWSADVAMVCVVEKSECFANEFGKSQGAVETIVDAHHRLSRLAAGTALALRVAHCPPLPAGGGQIRPCIEIVCVVVIWDDDGPRRHSHGKASGMRHSNGHGGLESTLRHETAIGEHGGDGQAINDLLLEHECHALFDRHPEICKLTRNVDTWKGEP